MWYQRSNRKDLKHNMNYTSRFSSLLLLLLFVALSSSRAFAQSATTGSIEGAVIDVNGAAVPGVTVNVTSPNLISAQSATANDQGRYRVLNLPPGKYTVTVEAAKGFSRFEQTVDVNLSKTASLDVQLQAAGATASVTVTESAGAGIDTTANTTGSNISTEQFSNFPTQRTVQSLFTLAPTVARSGLRDASGRDRDPSVAGSSGPESNFILDGVNTSDPAFGGSGANLPFEFVQEIEIKTGAFGAEFGKTTGGIFNVITKSGGNEFHGDGFAYFSTKGLVRKTTQFPFTLIAPDGFSEIDAGVDVGGPIKKDKLWFFGAFNPQRRANYALTQTFHIPVSNTVTTPFYSGKVTYAINPKNTLTFSTFGDFTKQEGFNIGGGFTGFGDTVDNGKATILTGGHNYTARLNSTINPNWIAEFAFGLHLQRLHLIPFTSVTASQILDSFAVVGANGAALTPTHTNVVVAGSTGTGDFVNGTGGSLGRVFQRGPGYGPISDQNRNRVELSARLTNIWGKHTLKYGFEYGKNIYKINTRYTGQATTYDGISVKPPRITNNFGVCTVRDTQIACPAQALTDRIQALLTAGVNLGGGINSVITDVASISQISTNPFLIRTSTRVRDFELFAPSTHTNMEAFYLQDDFKITKTLQLNVGARWDYQQAYGSGNFSYVKLNNFKDNLEPRAGFTWDFTGQGKGKVFANFARFIETPLPLDINVRAGSDTTQTDINLNVDTINAPAGSHITANIGNLGSTHTPIDPGLKPQDVYEGTAGFEYEVKKDFVVGFRGIYRAQHNVIEDGSFNDGVDYFLFNPGRRGQGETTEDKACADPTIGCFGHARRYYRALEFTATKRFTNNYQFIASYVYSSLTGNYEGLFRNDNGQADPNITSLFDLVSLLKNQYGHLPNDRPHQFKFDGSYRTPWKLQFGASFRAQSGIPFNQLIPHPVYGNNEGFQIPRGTAIVPAVTTSQVGFPNVVNSIGSNRTPTTFNLDMNAHYPIRLGEKKELSFQADWFNVFNNQRAIRLDETFSINSGIPGVANIPANRLPNPFYGAGTIFQFPSSLRLGVKFTF
jgi:outer membrane receptor protein involved in Fe transport